MWPSSRNPACCTSHSLQSTATNIPTPRVAEQGRCGHIPTPPNLRLRRHNQPLAEDGRQEPLFDSPNLRHRDSAGTDGCCIFMHPRDVPRSSVRGMPVDAYGQKADASVQVLRTSRECIVWQRPERLLAFSTCAYHVTHSMMPRIAWLQRQGADPGFDRSSGCGGWEAFAAQPLGTFGHVLDIRFIAKRRACRGYECR